jgi:lipoate-protein ligase A
MPALFTASSWRSSPRDEGWLLPFLELDGPVQMTLDHWLLEQSSRQQSSRPLLRFYGWKGPWLSLGRHQRAVPAHWQAMAAAGKVSLVRRPSGGGAVLHAGGLTYALIWPQAPRQRREAYAATSDWLSGGLRRLGHCLRGGEQPAEAGLSHCFASASAADLMDAMGHKRIGSAQYWRHGHLLQHGEILIEPPAQLWFELFNSLPPPPLQGLTREGLVSALRTELEQRWDHLQWVEPPLDQQDLNQIQSLSALYLLEPRAAG